MTGRTRLPGGEPRKASQRRTRQGEQLPTRISRRWRAGDRVRWRDHDGVFKRDLGDGENAEVLIGERLYRAPIADLDDSLERVK